MPKNGHKKRHREQNDFAFCHSAFDLYLILNHDIFMPTFSPPHLTLKAAI